LKRPIVLITGAAGGIGFGCARLFAESGWRVFGVDLNDSSDPSVFESFMIADVSMEDAWKEISRTAAREFGGVDALVNCAAVQICKPLVETSLPEWDRTIAVNLRSAYLSVYHMHSLMKERDASIVNICSVHAVATSVNMAAYAASKGALAAMTRALAVELADDGIRVNSVLPGAVDTPMLRGGLARGHLAGDDIDAMLDNLARKTVLGRIGRPAEIAQAVLFMADSERSSFMTGECMTVDGGATARLSTE